MAICSHIGLRGSLPFVPRTCPHLSAVLLFIAIGGACGEPSSFPDASPGGDGPAGDGGDPLDGAGARGKITVNVRSHDGRDVPDVGAEVYFTDGAGAVIDTVTVDATGIAIGTGADGGAVTVRHAATDGPDRWSTVFAVAVGDVLRFGRPASAWVGTMTVNVPATAGAIRYHATGPCIVSFSASSTAIQAPYFAGCEATRPLVAVADRGAQPRLYILVPDAMPADGAVLTLAGPWIAPVAGPTITVSGTSPSATTSASVTYHVAGRPAWATLATVTPGSPLTVSTTRLAGLGDAMSLALNTFDGHSYSITAYTSPPPTSTWEVDATPILPRLSDPVWSGNGGSWTVEQPGRADAIVVQGEALGEKGEELAGWEFLLPPDATSIARPIIPGAPAVGLTSLSIHDVDVVDGYDEFRPGGAAFVWRGGGPWPPPASYVSHHASR